MIERQDDGCVRSLEFKVRSQGIVSRAGHVFQLRTMNSELRTQQAFTLVELMLVVIIIGVLAAMVVPRLAGRTEQAKIARAKSDLASIGLALDLYELDMGEYPKDLQSLITQPAGGSGESRWNGPYLKKGLPDDPWGRHYEYKVPPEHGHDYDLSSLGADGQKGTDDDVTNWK